MRRLATAVVAAAALLLPAAPSAARKPVIAYVDPASGVFSLYDAETETSPAAPALPNGIARYAMSSNGRFVVFEDPATRRPAPARPHGGRRGRAAGHRRLREPAVADGLRHGLIAFDDNGNGPARVYDSARAPSSRRAFRRATATARRALSADGNRLATTCLGGLARAVRGRPRRRRRGVRAGPRPRHRHRASPTTWRSPTRRENRPCLDGDGSVVGLRRVRRRGDRQRRLPVRPHARRARARARPADRGARARVPARRRRRVRRRDGRQRQRERLRPRRPTRFLTLPAALQGLPRRSSSRSRLPRRPASRRPPTRCRLRHRRAGAPSAAARRRPADAGRVPPGAERLGARRDERADGAAVEAAGQADDGRVPRPRPRAAHARRRQRLEEGRRRQRQVVAVAEGRGHRAVRRHPQAARVQRARPEPREARDPAHRAAGSSGSTASWRPARG